ncbi:MAG: hypothetical protein HRT73_03450, partial [Flavobacteriales bacterium]|nr:hypothetical protein [Flavobacteriales bacterium]
HCWNIVSICVFILCGWNMWSFIYDMDNAEIYKPLKKLLTTMAIINTGFGA